MRDVLVAAPLLALALATPAAAEVRERWDDGFVVTHVIQTTASPEAAYAMTGQPGRWWNKDHTWSGDAARLSMTLEPGGCFCEALGDEGALLEGGVRHGTVAMAWPGRRLVLDAALGPLLGMASGGWLSFDYEAAESGGTEITVRYRVEGHGLGALADPVDGVIGEQANRLKATLDAG